MQTTSVTVTKFTYPSYKRLEFMLGRIDAIATVAELLIRKLLSAASNSGGMEKYLRSLAAGHHMNLTHVDQTMLPLRNTQLHLVSIHQVFADFLTAFKREHPLSSTWKSRKDDEGQTEHVWAQVMGKGGIAAEADTELKLTPTIHRLTRPHLKPPLPGFVPNPKRVIAAKDRLASQIHQIEIAIR